jgi:hypothetical protein
MESRTVDSQMNLKLKLLPKLRDSCQPDWRLASYGTSGSSQLENRAANEHTPEKLRIKAGCDMVIVIGKGLLECKAVFGAVFSFVW